MASVDAALTARAAVIRDIRDRVLSWTPTGEEHAEDVQLAAANLAAVAGDLEGMADAIGKVEDRAIKAEGDTSRDDNNSLEVEIEGECAAMLAMCEALEDLICDRRMNIIGKHTDPVAVDHTLSLLEAGIAKIKGHVENQIEML